MTSRERRQGCQRSNRKKIVRQKLIIFVGFIFLIIVLVGLNAASYTQKEKTPDNEVVPNRSTYNTGATGTRALFDLLAESGRKVTRWQESPSALLSNNKNKPSTFIIIGRTRREFDEKEIEQLLFWVSSGGKLVIIDREPPPELMTTTANWRVSAKSSTEEPFFDIDPSNQQQMTEKTVAAKPVQPTIFTRKVNAVQSSRFASSFKFERFSDGNAPQPTPVSIIEKDEDYDEKDKPPPPLPKIKTEPIESASPPTPEDIETPALTAPVVHLANEEKNLLVDVPFGSGEIVYLTDPYIVSNGGISLVDNAQLAVNIVASREGIIAFDEYHQGYGAGENRLLAYFAGTPLAAIFLQFVVLVGLVLFSNSRRFARPLPENEPNRLSKLEYVAAMAELQQRTKAFDLAIENIYTDFRRRTARLVGVDNFTTSHQDLAKLIAERANLNAVEVENLMFISEEIIRGEPTNKKEVLQITSRLREIEKTLGLLGAQTALSARKIR